MPILEKIKIDLRERAYDIVIGYKNLEVLGEYVNSLKCGNEAFIITSPRISALYGHSVMRSLKSSGFKQLAMAKFPDGEENKSLESYVRVMNQLYRFDRYQNKRFLIVNLGGGVVGDLGGFVAATYRRGMNYIQVPTTLLALVDSGIGGKVGINWQDAKNMVGAFYQPRLVYVDMAVLKTLPKREMLSGMAEVIKYGVIEDPGLFKLLEMHYRDIISLKDWDIVRKVVSTSYKIKARIVERDERDEKGIRIRLNFGHTLGHAFEAATGYRCYKHGEAVALGMICAGEIAHRLGIFRKDELGRLEELIGKVGLPLEIKGCNVRDVINSMRHDKKFIGGRNRFVLPTKIGNVRVIEGIDEGLIKEVIKGRME